MINTHTSIQLSIGAVALEGIINLDKELIFTLLPGAEDQPREPTKTTLRKVQCKMRVPTGKNEKGGGQKVFSYVSKDRSRIVTGYFGSLDSWVCNYVEKISSSIAAQLLYWLIQRGCSHKEVDKSLKICSSLEQLQKMTSSKYNKTMGYAVVTEE